MSSHSLYVRAIGRGARVVAGALALLLTEGMTSNAKASEPDAAEALFRDGRRLLDEGKLVEACTTLAESHRLDPSPGTLLNLADCYERRGKLASAWSEFLAAARLAEERDERERSAEGLRRATLLAPKLAYLAVHLAPTMRGATIKRDGQAIEVEQLGVWLPIDPGEHVITAEVSGRVTFRKSVRAAGAGGLRVEVTALAPEAGTRQVAAPKKAPPEGSHSSLLPTRLVAGYTASGFGLAALGVGAALFMGAKAEYSNAEELCPGGQCEESRRQPARDVLRQGDSQALAANISFGLGAASLVAGGCLLFWPTLKEKPRSATTRVGVTIAPTPGGAMLSGVF
ncbi:MAG: hypothetical protein MUF34_31610 [Polyangiaceae bacterium]|jgi:tetratricopeptide (TPR) repeat protein|nr:hypothetical protein [Polyangiaceae bacterium]